MAWRSSGKGQFPTIGKTEVKSSNDWKKRSDTFQHPENTHENLSRRRFHTGQRCCESSGSTHLYDASPNEMARHLMIPIPFTHYRNALLLCIRVVKYIVLPCLYIMFYPNIPLLLFAVLYRFYFMDFCFSCNVFYCGFRGGARLFRYCFIFEGEHADRCGG